MVMMIKNKKSLNPFDIVFICVISAAFGVAYWGWTFAYEIFKPFLQVFGLKYLSAGFWIIASIFVPSIIRRPMVALTASLIAAFIESLLTQWGLSVLFWGLAQGLGSEVIFFLFRYHRWDSKVLFLATFSSTTCSYLLDYFYYDYALIGQKLNTIQYFSFLASAFLFAFGLTLLLTKKLRSTGLLESFSVSPR
jgi:energy-coupling factor transport system permease protein